MKTYSCFEKPMTVFGVPFFEEKKIFERVPADVREKLERIGFLGKRTPGARLGFRTNASEFTVRIKLASLSPDIGMSIFSCQSVNVMIGDRKNSRFAGLVSPPDYNTKEFEKTIYKKAEMEEVTLWLPRNEIIESVEVDIDDNATVEEATPYTYKNVVFYGSSITEGGCCCNVTNNYVALLSRWLDMDFYNLGFSGAARGELEMADYINTFDMDLFVMDYDHNAPTVEHLAQTHEPFFKRIREKHPDVPVLFLTRPNFDHTSNGSERRDVVMQTYLNAKNNGDKNVYFVDGETFFGDEDRQLCTIDMTHPNDLGFYRMAKTILPVMKEILGEK